MKRFVLGGLVTIALAAVLAAHLGKLEARGTVQVVFIVLFATAGFRVIASWLCKPRDDPPFRGTIGVVVPFYNEDPDYLRLCLDSLMGQSRSADVIYLVDDGSDSVEASRVASTFPVNVIIQERRGKRHAQLHAFADHTVDVWVTVDSDTVLAPTALDEVSKPFSDPDVTSVAGLLLGRNRRRNLMTRIIDLEFVQSFIVGRAGPGLFGSVMTTCGALAAYRGDVIRDNIGTYAEQTIMGKPMNNGDDRFLTQAAHLKGMTVFAERAVGYTALPENLSHLIRQRLRWSSSWYWGMSHLLRTAPLHRPALWMALVESWTFVMYTTVLVLVVASGSLPEVLPWWAAYMTMLSYIYGVRYVSLDREDAPLTDRLLTWLVCAPLVSVLYWLCLNPVRYASIFMVRGSNWLTRQKVEVHA